MPDITQVVFSIADDSFEGYEDSEVVGEGGGGGASPKAIVGSKTARAVRQNIVANAKASRRDAAESDIKKTLVELPEFKSESEETQFFERYISWVGACLQMGEVLIRDDDLDFEFFRSGGPGGQNVNKVSSGVRVIHLPTNISAKSTKTPDQHKNREFAVEGLLVRLERHIDSWRLYLNGDLDTLNVSLIRGLFLASE